MLQFNTVSQIQEHISLLQESGKTIGFVPTMGALHKGHISLIKRALEESDIVVCSIFVNPIQFNKKEDLDNYPRTLENDCLLLEKAGCNAVFIPSVEEIYPIEINELYEFGDIGSVMEGKFRPGHFNGVAVVVKRLFDIIQPHKAFFGEKDFQQLAIIKYIVNTLQLPVQIVACPIMREADGLAMSSRNLRLTTEERAQAPFIYETLHNAKELSKTQTPQQIKDFVINNFESNPVFRLEYFELVNSITLQPVQHFSSQQKTVGCIAVYLGNVRLIDVMEMR